MEDKKLNMLLVLEKAIIIGLSLNVAYLLFNVVFKAATAVLCNLVNPYNICVVLCAVLVWQASQIVKQGTPQEIGTIDTGITASKACENEKKDGGERNEGN